MAFLQSVNVRCFVIYNYGFVIRKIILMSFTVVL